MRDVSCIPKLPQDPRLQRANNRVRAARKLRIEQFQARTTRRGRRGWNKTPGTGASPQFTKRTNLTQHKSC